MDNYLEHSLEEIVYPANHVIVESVVIPDAAEEIRDENPYNQNEPR